MFALCCARMCMHDASGLPGTPMPGGIRREGESVPINIVVGLIALLVALVLYSMGAWGAFRAKTFTRRQITYIWLGFAFDVLATAMMAIAAKGLDLAPLSHLLHTVIAFAAMFGMMALAIMGGRALSAAKDASLKAVARWALVPWALWVFVFVWGMVSRGAQRAG